MALLRTRSAPLTTVVPVSKSSDQESRAARTQRTAAALEAERRRNRNRQLASVGAVVLVVVLVVGALYVFWPSNDSSDVDAAPAGASEYSLGVGDPEAPTEVVVYEDFLCPFCGQFEAASGDELQRLADDGQVYVEYRPLNFLSRIGDYSERATNAFAAVLDSEGPEVAKTFHDALFANQPSESGPFPDDDALVQLAVESGADEESVRPAIEDLAFEDWVDQATQEASEAGVSATPTILVDGEPFTDGQTVEELSANLISTIEQG